MARKPLALLVLVVGLMAVLMVPGLAQAAVTSTGLTVCNEAQSSPRGVDIVPDQSDPNPPARHKDAAMPVGNGNGVGLENAAANSPALALCLAPPPGGPGGGGIT
jgi:hypothetical protein